MILNKVSDVCAQSESARERIRDLILETPCVETKRRGAGGKKLYLKSEDLQRTGSFKIRGAAAKLTCLSNEIPVITASSGNHGIACSLAAQSTGQNLTVVLPEHVAPIKLEKIKSFGTNVILHPGDSGIAERHARQLADDEGYVYVSPYNDSLVVAGQGTIGLEILEQVPKVESIFVSMGGGGLISGIGSVIKSRSCKTKVIGVAAENSAALAKSLEAGRVVDTVHSETLADGCAGGMDHDSLTFPLAQSVVDDVVYVSERQIADAMRELAWSEGRLVEGAAAMALAAYQIKEKELPGLTSVVVLCGSNFDKSTMQKVLLSNG
ncbi:MAG: pyridoxal-phosphate dependent enzyme [Planctomycetota bacterium]